MFCRAPGEGVQSPSCSVQQQSVHGTGQSFSQLELAAVAEVLALEVVPAAREEAAPPGGQGEAAAAMAEALASTGSKASGAGGNFS